MSDYGRNFGFLRSDEHVRVSEGRFKTPAASALRLGTVVEIDPAEPGYLKQSASNASFVTGFCGLLLQELGWDSSIYDANALDSGNMYDSYQKGIAKADARSIITSGAGTKVWFKNTGSETRADGRVIGAVTMFTQGTIAVGESLGWNGSAFVEVGGGVTNELIKVTEVTTGYVAGVLLA